MNNEFGLKSEEERNAFINETLTKLEVYRRSNSVIPAEMVYAGDYMVRNNWWHGLYEEIDALQILGLFDSELSTKYELFREGRMGREFASRPKNQDDISAALDMLGEISRYFGRTVA